MGLIQEDWASYIISWNDCLIDFFEENRVFLEYPWKIRGVYKNGDKIRVQKSASLERYSCMPKNRIISMGSFSYSRTVKISPHFQCGRYCSIATGVELSHQEHPTNRISTHPFTTHSHMKELARAEFGKDLDIQPHRTLNSAPKIGHDVWIGADAMLKRGITIGTGAVIASRALVTKDVPPYAVVGGTPARTIRMRFDDSTLDRIISSNWWRYLFCDLPFSGTDEVQLFLDRLEELKESKRIEAFDPGYVETKDLLKYIDDNSYRW